MRSLVHRIAVEARAMLHHYISFVRMNRRISRPACALRLMTSGVVILGVFLAPFESLVPDVHDNVGSVVSALILSNPSIVSRDMSGGRKSPPVDSSSGQTKEHPFHADHCSHGHCFSLGTSSIAVSLGYVRRLAVETASLELLSVSLSPRHRPPIA